jgi:hypothetical protein
MYRRDRHSTRRKRRGNYQDRPDRNFFTSLFRTPSAQIAVLLVVALIIFLILQNAGR